MKARKKPGTDMPPKLKAFIDSVINTPLENIEAPLSHFTWDYEKGDFHHWVDLFYHFDSYFEKHVKVRKDLQLDGDCLEADGLFPKDAVLQILRVTAIILENCSNKYLYCAHEHVAFLLASTDAEVVRAALLTLAALVKKPIQSNRTLRWHGDPVVNEKLFSLSQGWGGKEEGLGLLPCAIENGSDASSLGSTLHFQFYANASDAAIVGDSDRKDTLTALGLQVIHIPEVHLRPEGDLQLLMQLSDQYQVPERLRFSLFTRLRFARAFHSLNVRRQYICIRLLAFTVLLQSNPDHEDLTAFFVNEPEFVNELVTLLHTENNVPEDIRILAIFALSALAQDRPRQSNVLTVVSAGGHRGILPSLVQEAVVSLTTHTQGCSVAYVEALLSLVAVLVSSSSGCAALREAGLIPTLLPLLKDSNPFHMDLVTSAVHILEAFMDYSNPAGTLFRDLGGLDDTIARLQYEVCKVEKIVVQVDPDVPDKSKSLMIGNTTPQQMAQPEVFVPYRQRNLLKSLLRAIALGTYSLSNLSRLHGAEESTLPACLCSIFKHSKEFGGGVFSLAASVMSDLINKDPTCFPVLHAVGLPTAFLGAVTAGVLPSSDAVGCIPHALDALCLNQAGLQAVKDCNALHCFVVIFTSKLYLQALSGDTPGAVASGLDELMRHAPSLRGPGIDTCIEILNRVAVIGGANIGCTTIVEEISTTETPIPMETDFEEKGSVCSVHEGNPSNGLIAYLSDDKSCANVESFLLACINNSIQLLETLLQNADTCRVFIEKKGIEAMLQLFTLPYLPITFGGSSTAYNMSMTFRAFSSQHASTLTKAACNALSKHLKDTLVNLDSLSNVVLSDLQTEVQNRVIRHLSAVDCFLSLTSFLVRSLTPMMPMMTELGGGSMDIFSDIGKVHRWVLWQFSLVDDNDVNPKRDGESGSITVGSNMGRNGGRRETEDGQDVFPIVQHNSPVSSRSSRTSRWSIESELLPLLQIEQGLGRRSRRERGATSELLTHAARLGRLARHARGSLVDVDVTGDLIEGLQPHESTKRKPLDALIPEMLGRLVAAAQGFYVALGNAMVVPSRRRDDAFTVTPVAKSVASSLANLFRENLSFDGCQVTVDTSRHETSVLVKCRYLGKVVEDITAVVMDGRRRTCNTVMVNSLVAHGTIKQLLTTFEATSQLLWTVLQTSSCPMDTEAGEVEGEAVPSKASGSVWVLNTVQSYGRLLECLTTSSLLLTPPSMGHLLIQPVVGGIVPIPRSPEAFVLNVQKHILEVVLPVWNHPLFPQCSVELISLICSIMIHAYLGVIDVKTHTVSGTVSTRSNGPPPDESAISVIVEMGFSRSRAEEALRRIGTNSVEMAMEWLFSHPGEASQEDDELARALALSLSNGGVSVKDDEGSKSKHVATEEVELQLPSVESMLSTSMDLLRSSDALAFSLTDLLVTIILRKGGQDRPRVVSYLIQQLSFCKIEESDSDSSPLSTVSHLLTLILSEDSLAREIASKNGLVSTVLDILTCFKPIKAEVGEYKTPKWVTALVLVLDHMLQYNPRTDLQVASEPRVVTKLEENDDNGLRAAPACDSVNGSEKVLGKPWELILGTPNGYMTDQEQQRTVVVACNFIHMKLTAVTMQAVFQLCARLTKVHTVAMRFFEAGGLSALLNLPRSCLFPGFDSVAATIIRHLLEDSQTLQQAMESEIRHSLPAILNRHNGRVLPRIFLTAMAPVIARDPAIFMQAAAASVCQLETTGERLYVILSKEKEKDKDKEKEKDKGVDKEKEKSKGNNFSSDETRGVTVVNNGATKVCDSSVKSSKGYKKATQSFSHVIEQLLDVILYFVPPKNEILQGESSGPVLAIPMDVDDLASKDKGKGKLDEDAKLEKTFMSENSSALAKVTFILKLMTEVLLMYSSAVSVVLRRDAESSLVSVPCQASPDGFWHGGLLYHVLHRLLPDSGGVATEKLVEDDWKEKLSSKAGNFLIAICVRSAEGRRRIFSEIGKALNVAACNSELSLKEGSKPPDRKVCSFVDLLNNVLSSQTSLGSVPTPGLSTEMAKAMLDAGMVQALTVTLQMIDLDHPTAPNLVNGIVKALEALTRVASSGDQVRNTEINTSKKGTLCGEMLLDPRTTANGQSSDTGHQGDQDAQRSDTVSDSMQADLQTVITAMQALVGPDPSRGVRMDHDTRLDREDADDIHLQEEEEFMREAAEGGVAVAVAVALSMDDDAGEDLGEDEEDDDNDDDDDEMDGDGGDEDEDDEDEEEEEDGEDADHLSPDTDVDDHELEDEYDEDMIEDDEDQDDAWQENRVIEVRWRDGLTGLNRVQVLGHTGEGNLADFPIDSLEGLNIGAFRRTGGDQRRAPTYRPFLERTGSGRGRTFQHPLLTRPTLSSGTGLTGVAGNSFWSSVGTLPRETELVLSGGVDVAHFYMYDGPMLLENATDGMFGNQGSRNQPQSFFEFSLDPVYRMGRRGGRSNGRLSNWTEDGQSQGSGHAAAIAQALEAQFVTQLRRIAYVEESATAQPTFVPDQSSNGNADRRESLGEVVVDSANRSSQENVSDHQANMMENEQLDRGISISAVDGNVTYRLAGEVHTEQGCCAELDVHMHNERSEPAVRDVEAASQDSSGSGATLGESLRSLEVEIGSADGHDEGDRQAGTDRLNTGEIPVREVLGRSVGIANRLRHIDEDMNGTGIVAQPVEERTRVSADLHNCQDSTVEGAREQRDDQDDAAPRVNGDANMNLIDPTFLEALPEDLRAEVLASQQNQTARAMDHPSSQMEDIDPEFLAALPPDIQAEVLSQQQALRLLQAQQVEGQPVDMDSASIIATFPADLREEVLLTSSEAVLAALPPALLAEARVLRERAMNQYHARTLFGGGHRLGGRRNSIAIGTCGGSTAMDRAIGGGSSLASGRQVAVTPNGGCKGAEADGKPLVDVVALKAMLRLLRLAQPLGKGLLQRLLLNLCAHSNTRTTLIQLLLDILRPDAGGYSLTGSLADGALSYRLYGCQWNVVYARPQLSDGVPPLVSRRVLEILTYLARNHSLVANLLLYFEPVTTLVSEPVFQKPCDKTKEKGKAKLADEGTLLESSEGEPVGEIPLLLLLKLLSQPLYLRSSSHLEQVMGLLEVITSNAAVLADLHNQHKARENPSTGESALDHRQGTMQGTIHNLDAAAVSLRQTPDNVLDEPLPMGTSLEVEVPRSSEVSHADGGTETSNSNIEHIIDPSSILLSLPTENLRHLCLLLAREGLSDVAYDRIAEVLKKIATVAPPHRHLFIAELAVAAQRLSGPAVNDLQNLGSAETAVFSTASMVGGAILRVLLALSALVSEGGLKDKSHDNVLEKEQEDILSVVQDLNAALEPLCQALSVCVGRVESRLSSESSGSVIGPGIVGSGGISPPLPPGTQCVLPFIEAFFVLCDKLRPVSSLGQQELSSSTACEIKEAANSSLPFDTTMVSRSLSLQQRKVADERGVTFIRFAEKHRRLLNAFVRQNPGLLEKSLSLLLRTPRLIDFDNKRSYFRSRIRQQHEQRHYSPLRISVRRAYVLEDSYNQLRMRTPDELKGRLTVQFQGEEGIDAGGLTREWYQLLSRVIFDKGALLFTTVGNESSFQPNPNSVYQTEHLSYFKFVGRVVAKALFDGQLLDVYFTRSFYKHILGVKVTYHDIEAVDPDFYKNLKWVLENDISDILGLTFSMDADEEKHILYEKTEVTDYELIPGGRNIRVTEENKHEYVDLVAEHRLTTAIRPQINGFLEGFNELVSKELISIFNDKELELLISGLPEIDLGDLKANTEYTGYTAAAPVVQWFWEVVEALNKEDMAQLLQFVTGTSKVPLEGFRALQGISGPQRFQIHKSYGAPERLPSAHTCFNQLDLPDYTSKEQLQERLLLAIHEASEGFGFG